VHAGPGVILEHTNQLVLVERWCSACWCRHAADCSMRRLGVRHRQHTTVNARIGRLNRGGSCMPVQSSLWSIPTSWCWLEDGAVRVGVGMPAGCSMRRLGVHHRQHTTVHARIGRLNRGRVVHVGPDIIVEHTNQLALVRR
jgi:hypothetical protein